MEISINLEIPDLGNYKIEIECPCCRLSNYAKLNEIVRREYIICRGCYSNLHLDDHLSSAHRTIKKINKTFQGLG